MKWILVTLAVMVILILFVIYMGGGMALADFSRLHSHGSTAPGSPQRPPIDRFSPFLAAEINRFLVLGMARKSQTLKNSY